MAELIWQDANFHLSRDFRATIGICYEVREQATASTVCATKDQWNRMLRAMNFDHQAKQYPSRQPLPVPRIKCHSCKRTFATDADYEAHKPCP